MPKINVRYERTRRDEDSNNYFVQNVQEFPDVAKNDIFVRRITRILILILVYFIFSISLTFYQKRFYDVNESKLPLVVVSSHLVLKYLFASTIRHFRKCCKSHQQICHLSWQNIMWTLVPPGVASGLDIGLSNWGMSLVTMSMYTMTKSTTVIFILGFAVLFKLERKSWLLGGIVFMISGGLIMFTYESSQFNLLGFSLCLLASFVSGIRWTLTQMIMQRSKLGLRNPVDMMYFTQPWMFLSIFPFALYIEGRDVLTDLGKVDWDDSSLILLTVSSVFCGAVLAFSMEIAEFLVVTYGSSLTLSIAGIFKEICILVIAYKVRGDKMSGLNFVGLLLCLGGITLHVIQKIMISKQDSVGGLELQSSSLPSTSAKATEMVDSNLPLIMEKSSSLTNLLNANFSSDEEEEIIKENSRQLLSNIVQRRE
ncbi:hypothetical protein QAD02_023222 [Eretmocerus hayati]|uniref:Uncharacterized protein n=1 Tax=Eretmocerus hayati TaxID=131215 RepID=A0ACC2PVB1_9HYME|nr:hypothetical protein QAD02_023222 [Eretmocerus hayati]